MSQTKAAKAMYKVQRRAGEVWVTIMGGFATEMAAKMWIWDQEWFLDPANLYQIVR